MSPPAAWTGTLLPACSFPKSNSFHRRHSSGTPSVPWTASKPYNLFGDLPPSPASSIKNQEDTSPYPQKQEEEAFEEDLKEKEVSGDQLGGTESFGGKLVEKESLMSKLPWTEEQEHLVREPFDYVYSQKGKNLRGQMMAALNMCLHVPEERATIIDSVVGMLHTASLLIDDIEDGSDLRRGKPASHIIYGVPQTINSANYVYFLAMQESQKLSDPRAALQIFTEELIQLHRGQGMDLFWRDAGVCPTEEQYIQMVADKTGGLFRILARLMMLESPTNLDCLPFIDLVGVIFQIRDDYMNLVNAQYTTEKGLAEDLTEGKFSFPIIHAIRADPSSHVLMNIMSRRTQDDAVKRFAVGYMEEMGSFEHCRIVLRKLMARAREEVVTLGGSAGLTKILDKLDLECESSA